MRKEYLTQLHNIINHYDRYKEIAVPLKWAETQSSSCDASHYGYELYFRLYTVRFKEGYLQAHFSEAFVQMMLTMLSYSEEWEPDRWAHLTPEERLASLVKGEEFYREYLCFEKLRLEPITTPLGDLIRSELPDKTLEEAEDPDAFLEAQRIATEYSQSEVIWLGGYIGDGCTPDENWLAIQDDTFIFVAWHRSG